MRLTYKYRLYPTEAQVGFLDGELREACSLYNAALEERVGAWKICHKSVNYYDQANQLKAMRADGCLTLANFSCCQDVLRRVDKTFKAFFGRVKRGDKPGFPRYRSSRRYDSITFPSYGDGCRLLDTGKLRVQGAGHIKINLHRPLEGAVKTVTIKREAVQEKLYGTARIQARGYRLRHRFPSKSAAKCGALGSCGIGFRGGCSAGG